VAGAPYSSSVCHAVHSRASAGARAAYRKHHRKAVLAFLGQFSFIQKAKHVAVVHFEKFIAGIQP